MRLRTGPPLLTYLLTPGVLRVGAMWVLPVSVQHQLWGGEGVSVCWVGLEVMSHRRVPSLCVSWRVSCRRLTTYEWSLGAGSSRGWTLGGWSPSRGIYPPRRPESTVLCSLPARPADQALAGGFHPGPLPQLPQLRVGPVLPSQSMGGSVAFGGGVSRRPGARGGVSGTGGGVGPRGVPVVLCPGVRGDSAGREPTRTCGYTDRDSASGFGWGWREGR